MSDQKSYDKEWKKLDNLSSGGQGTTFIASPINDASTVVVVKTLNRHGDEGRRVRTYREVTTLSTLEHKSLPKVIDSNAHHYKDLEFKLFLATEYIPGPTLSNVDFKKYSLEEKSLLFRKILEVLNYCHQQGIIHRDIKPDNIIIRNEDLSDPVILDFGLSFNANEKDDDNRTPSEEHLGNRFLILPEQKVGEAAKRDFKSDIACSVGLFFFFLMGIQPTVLIDGEGQKPHQRKEAKSILEQLPSHQLEIVNNLFNVGFESVVSKRWQSIQSLIEQLDFLDNSKPQETSDKISLIESIKSKQQKKQYKDVEFLKNIYNEVNKNVRTTLTELTTDLGANWGRIQSGGFIPSQMAYKNRLAPSNSVVGFEGHTTIYAYSTGSELVIKLIEPESNEVEVFRPPLEGEKNWAEFREKLKNHYLEQINRKL